MLKMTTKGSWWAVVKEFARQASAVTWSIITISATIGWTGEDV